MKKLLLCGLALIVCAAVYAESTKTKTTAAGMQIGTSRSQAIGFWGVTPVTQQVVVATGSDSATLTNILNELVRMGIVRTN